MSEALTELIFWIVIFLLFFYGFRWLQNRKKAAREKDVETHAATKDDTSG